MKNVITLMDSEAIVDLNDPWVLMLKQNYWRSVRVCTEQPSAGKSDILVRF
ncbi:hypothetical protein MGA5115_03443 [Marinomonas gallaica]|uniref:Uncharacterized protein n=1 Tax=Marinomonas gallaica TaxID=1806667 RepID=A0A1C3JVK0_9GAMM|nr:hypothetical protein [Marinomonas gallaica]SBT19281.1 hypothetical protein MGA5115_03443 [Marinomonas gallaica]SBT20971.1 hypothetical protein MGA5116_01558 [Marinomonas gallaica]